jgi:two-component system LytT family sensor kinase
LESALALHGTTSHRTSALSDESYPLISEGWRDDVSTVETSSRNPSWWAILLSWSTLAVLAMLQLASGYAYRGQLAKEWLNLLFQIPRWLLWAPLTPLIFATVRRYPIRRGSLARSLPAHAVVALCCMAFAETLSTFPFILIEEAQRGPSANRPGFLVLTYLAVAGRLLTGFIAYSAVVSIATMRESQRRLRERETRAAKLEADLAQAQVQAIKMQVQPHFLFNTLHAINVLIRQDPATATRMVTQLGDLLRHTLSRATVTEVPLRSELEILTLYFDIERVRFRDRLSIAFDTPPETLDALVPDLVLQPLAENAIKHGISQAMEAGTITVRSRKSGDRLVLEIHDTGAGPPIAGSSERIGLTTVRARLERLYGAAHSLTIERGDQGGCIARIRLPFRTDA